MQMQQNRMHSNFSCGLLRAEIKLNLLQRMN